jgi:hypothetical protein
MQNVVLALGLLGAIGSAILGSKWVYDLSENRAKLADLRRIQAVVQDPELDRKVAKIDRVIRAAFALVGGALLGALAECFAFYNRGVIAGPLYLIAFATPLLLLGEGRPAILTFGLAGAGLLAFLIPPPEEQTLRPFRRRARARGGSDRPRDAADSERPRSRRGPSEDRPWDPTD